MKRILWALFWVVAVTLFGSWMIAMSHAGDNQKPQVGRYEMKVFADGEVVVFDTSSGQARVVRPGTVERLVPPEDLPAEPPPAGLKSF